MTIREIFKELHARENSIAVKHANYYPEEDGFYRFIIEYADGSFEEEIYPYDEVM